MTAKVGVKKVLSRTKVKSKKTASKRVVKEEITYQLDVHIATGNEFDKEIVETIIGKYIDCDEGVETVTFYSDGGILVVPVHRLIFARRFEYVTEERK